MFKKVIVISLLFLMSFTLVACKAENESTNTSPTLTGDVLRLQILGEPFNPLEGITAEDNEDGDLTSDIIVISNNINIDVLGEYTVVLEITDSDDNKVTLTITVIVENNYANYENGIDLSKLSEESKAIINAALENYLLDTVAGGVPLYRETAQVIFSDRVNVFSPEYNGLLGFGSDFSNLLNDDSSVLMYDDVYGETGEYTWRTSFNTSPNTFNYWLADDSNSTQFISRFTGGLYAYYFDDSKTGYEINPSLAATDPIPVNPKVIDGKTYATVWQIPLRDDLVWSFNPDIDTSNFATNYEKLDASDYLWTWQLALENEWFRAVSGGSDFITKNIKNAAEFVDGTVTNFNDVGLSLAEGETNVIELEFTTNKSAYDVKFMFNGTSLSPINQELFEAVGKDNYGLSPNSVASSGIYILDTYASNQAITFIKNNNHPDALMYHYTAYQYRFIEGEDQVFAEFLAGHLDSAIVPFSRMVEFANNPQVKIRQNSSTWQLMINGFGTTENRDTYSEQYPGFGISNTWIPEPILMYPEMKQALYYGFDRDDATTNTIYAPAFTLLAPMLFIDQQSGISVRGTTEGRAILEKFGGNNYGYNPVEALSLFKEAINQAISDGYYQTGTEDNYTEIELQLYYSSSSNNPYLQAMANEIKTQYEELLVDNEHFIKIIITLNDVPFPEAYTDHAFNAEMDLTIGSISNTIYNSTGIFNIYGDNNLTGWTSNWGIDTHTPNITITYLTLENVEVTEVWSFNALVNAINGITYIKDGVIYSTKN